MGVVAIGDDGVETSLNPLLRAYVPPIELRRQGPTLPEILGSAFEQENLLFNLHRFASRPGFDFQEGFDPLSTKDASKPYNPTSNGYLYLDGFDSFASQFINARSVEEADFIKEEIRRELENRRILDEAGGTGILARMAAGLLDPLLFVPGGAAFKAGRGGVSFLKTSIAAGAATAGIVGVQEAVLQAAQVTRTPEESMTAVGGSFLLGGLLGGSLAKLGSYLDPAGIRGMANDVEQSMFKIPEAGVVDPLQPGGLKIDLSKVDSLTTAKQAFEHMPGVDAPKVRGSLGFAHLAKFLSPRLQMFMSKVPGMRAISQHLVESPVALEGAAVRAPVETRVKMWVNMGRTLAGQEDDLYVQYLRSDPGAKATLAQRIFGFREPGPSGTGANFLTRDEFAQEVGKTLERGIDHAIPEVNKAAQAWHTRLIRPLAERAVDAGFLGKEILDKPGYLMRRWNMALLRNPDERASLVEVMVQDRRDKALLANKPFKETSARLAAKKTVTTLLRLAERRTLPHTDIGWRSPYHERMIEIDFDKVSRWLVTDTREIMPAYARSMSSELELGITFGLRRAANELDARRGDLIKAIRSAKTPEQAMRRLAKDSSALVAKWGNPTPPKGAKGSLKGAVAAERKGLAAKIVAAETEDEAIALLENADKNLIKDFSNGSMRLSIEEVERAYEPLLRAATTDAQAKRLIKQRNRDLQNLELARDDVRGVLGLGADAGSLSPSVLRVGRGLTYMATGGGIALSSMVDLSVLIMNHGIVNVFKHALIPMIADMKGARLGIENARRMLGPSEIALNSRSKSLLELGEEFVPISRIERGVNVATHAFSLANLMAPWNTLVSNIIALTTQGSAVEAGIRLAKGQDVLAGDLARLEEIGLDKDMLVRIGNEARHNGKSLAAKNAYAPQTHLWNDQDAADALGFAVMRSKSLNLVSGGNLDRPFVGRGIGGEVVKTLTMYMNYGLASNTRILTRALQYRDARALSGLMASVGMGMFADYLRSVAYNRPIEDDPKKLVFRGIARSGMSGAIFDLDRILEQASGGKVGVSAMMGITEGRYYSPKTAIGAVLGPVAGQTADMVGLVGGLTDLEFDESDAKRLRRLAPANQIFYLSRLFDKFVGD